VGCGVDPEHFPGTSVPVFSIGLAAEEQFDQQAELHDEDPMWTVPSLPFRDHIVAQPTARPDRMTEAGKHMPGVGGVSWEQFKEIIADTGDLKYGDVEHKRYEECTVPPGPDNNVIVAAVLVSWTR
jgi:hypothetical protein